MPDEFNAPHNGHLAGEQNLSGSDQSLVLTRLSFKTGLTIYLSAGFLLYILSRFHFLLFHSLVEVVSIILLITVFLIGWNTRELVRSQFFVILASGFLAAGLVDLLHTFTYKGMNVLPGADDNISAQLWLVARTLGGAAFLAAAFSLGRKELMPARTWLASFLLSGLFMLLLIWPLDLFPVCMVEGSGLTTFKIRYEYCLVVLSALSALLLLCKRHHLNPALCSLLFYALGLGALSAILLTLYVEAYGFYSFLGHYLKIGSVMLVYFALVEGTLRAPLVTLFREMNASYEELNLELRKRVAAETKQDLAHHEAEILYRMSRVMHSTLNLDELAHLILSAATSKNAGGFERATLFTVNQRTGMLQGMLGVSSHLASLVIPDGGDDQAWNNLHLDAPAREAQRLDSYNQKVVKQRLPLDPAHNSLASAFLDNTAVASSPESVLQGDQEVCRALNLGPFACLPLSGRDQTMGILLIDSPSGKNEMDHYRKRFLELFANQAGSALDNASLVKRLEMAHDDLQDVQEQLIHGEKMAVLGEMAAQVAHELRNPLVSVGGFARRLSEQDLHDARANEYADIVAREARRMEEMLDNILAFSKKQLVCFERCHLVKVLQEVVALELEHCQKQGIELTSAIPQSLPEITGDYRQLRQVFLNLLINARQAMGEGGVLTIKAREGTLRGEDAILVEVEDTGGGISPDIMRNIFNPFFSSSARGTGLGLSISHRIVAHHYGTIEVVNAEKGARFTVALPLEQPQGFKSV